jgi:uncharacterized membrane protein
MNTLMIVLRIIHIFSGIFWVGVSFFNIGFLTPTVQATAPGGQKVMGYLTQKTRFLTATYTAATLTLLSGLVMYWILSGFRIDYMTSGTGLVLAIGGVAGFIAWIIAIFVVRGIFNQMQAVGQAIQAQGGPPTAEQAAELQALSARLYRVGQWAVAILIIAVLGMSTAQYVRF